MLTLVFEKTIEAAIETKRLHHQLLPNKVVFEGLYFIVVNECKGANGCGMSIFLL